MVEKKEEVYTKKERNLINNSINFYRAKTFPDYQLDRNDKNTILEAIEFAHDKGRIIAPTDKHAHALMRSIQRKCGMEVEEPEDRQKRLARERIAVSRGIILEVAKKDAEEKLEIAEEAQEEVKKVEVQLAQAKAEDEGIAKAVAEAQKETLEAQQKAKEAEEEMAKLKAELAKEKQRAKDLEDAKVYKVIQKYSAEQLAKEQNAKLEANMKGAVQEVAEIKEAEEKSLEDKSIEEIVDELTKSE